MTAPDAACTESGVKLSRIPGSRPSRPKRRVLIVEDDSSIAECIEFALNHRGYEVMLAADGTEGLCRAERDFPELIILDVVLPRRSGLVLLERTRHWHPGPPRIILITGNDEPRHRDFALSRGADGFFAKPFDVEVLADSVDALFAMPTRTSA